MKKISLIALDIGGTLLSDDNTISDENIEAIKKAKAKNILIALVTAREYSSTKYIANKIGCDYGVFSNGSHLMNLKDLRSLSNSKLSNKAVLELYHYCKDNNLYIHLIQEKCEVSDRLEYFNLKHHLLNQCYPDNLKSSCYLIDDLSEYIPNNTFSKVIIVSENDLEKVIKDIKPILEKYHLFVTEYYKKLNEHILNKVINYIEIGSLNISKAEGLAKLADKLHISNNEILVLGDGDNDLKMLSSFNNTVCMANGSEEAKAVAKYITKNDNNHSGVAEGINHFINGGV